MTSTYRRMLLAARPEGLVNATNFTLDDTAPIPTIEDGEVLVKVRYLSIDPTIRGWLNDAPGYLPPIGLGEVIRSGGIGEVIASNNDAYPVGATVFGMLGWQEYAVVDANGQLTVVPEGVDPTWVLSVFGITGMTAYFGLLDIGQPQAGDTVVVSGAAGATGSVVGQIAKLVGASRVVGIAGTDEKCAWLTDELGFDAAINYRRENVMVRLSETCPDGIDVFFDNVGGRILDAALAHLAMKARVVICGAISQYNSEVTEGPKNYLSLISKRARMEGFLILDYLDRFPEAQLKMFEWVLGGSIQHKEDIVDGLEHAGDALNLLFSGENSGKVIVKI
jgi:NADPH-dependent curcumin reductase CurA